MFALCMIKNGGYGKEHAVWLFFYKDERNMYKNGTVLKMGLPLI